MIRRIITIPAAITALILASLLSGCLNSVPVKTIDPVADTAQDTTRYIDHNQQSQPALPVPEDQVADTVQDDVWSHIQKSEKLDQHDDKSKKPVQKYLQSYKNNQQFFDIIGTRAQPYLYYILNELEKREMPLFLALLPIIESGYKTDTTSSWKAAGLWQIIPSTGKHFGLKQNWWYDGRRDVIASTKAALDYLQQLHDRFDDWPLALAAYNSGGATVSNAIKKNVKLGRSTDFWALDLPPETRQYIPKLIALQTVISSPSSFGIELAQIPYEPAIKSVDTKGQIQLAKAAELANVDLDELKKLNAGHKRWATDPDGPYHLLVPVDSAERFTYAISMLPDQERVKWQHHEIKPGESLWTIARKYEISIHLLKTTNHLKTDKLRVGKNLLIPAGAFPEAIISVATDNSPKIPVLQDNKYRVKSGDSLWLIARRFDIHVQQILDWNKIQKDQPLKPGSELKILLEKPILEAAL